MLQRENDRLAAAGQTTPRQDKETLCWECVTWFWFHLGRETTLEQLSALVGTCGNNNHVCKHDYNQTVLIGYPFLRTLLADHTVAG